MLQRINPLTLEKKDAPVFWMNGADARGFRELFTIDFFR